MIASFIAGVFKALLAQVISKVTNAVKKAINKTSNKINLSILLKNSLATSSTTEKFLYNNKEYDYDICYSLCLTKVIDTFDYSAFNSENNFNKAIEYATSNNIIKNIYARAYLTQFYNNYHDLNAQEFKAASAELIKRSSFPKELSSIIEQIYASFCLTENDPEYIARKEAADKKEEDELTKLREDAAKYRSCSTLLDIGKNSKEFKAVADKCNMTPKEFYLYCKQTVDSFPVKQNQYNHTHKNSYDFLNRTDI